MKLSRFSFTIPLFALFLLLFSVKLVAQSSTVKEDKSIDSLPKHFSEKLFQKKEGNSLYTRLYNRFWAVDTSSSNVKSREATWLAVPVITYSPETKLNFEAVGLYSFYRDKKDLRERNSSVYSSINYSQNHQLKFEIKPTIWTSGNKYHFSSLLTYQNTNLKYYGIGNSTKLSNAYNQKTSYYRVELNAERLILKNLYVGPAFLFLKDDINLKSNFKSTYPATLPPTPSSGLNYSGHAAYFGLNLIYDNRDNQNYPNRGSFLNVKGQISPRSLSSTGELRQYNIDLRHFISLTKTQVLAFQGILNSENGSSVPFYFLKRMGNDQIMRGYYQGRYRDLNMTAAQVEYRYLFFPRFGLAAFAGTGEVFSNSFDASGLKPNYGFGGRYVFDMRSRITIRMDYGFGEKPAGEKRIGGFYLALGEAF